MNKSVLTSFTILCLLSTVFLIAQNIQTIKASGTCLLTIYTTEPDTKIQIGYGIYSIYYTTNSSGYLIVELPIGNYTLKATKQGYYSVTQGITLTGDKSIDIQMNTILYIAPTVHFTPTDVYIIPFMPQNYSTSTFYAEIPYSNWTENYYVDYDRLIYAEPAYGKTEHIKLIIHYDTYYPIIEIESSNTAMVRFNLTELYKHYYFESYLEKVERTQFTGFRLDSNVPIVFEFGMPKPRELWKITPEGTMTQLTDWNYENNTVLLSFELGDPTISMIFGDNYTNYHNLLADFNSLNMSYSSLNSSYNNLQASFNSLNSTYNDLRSNYQTLNSSYNNLNTAFNDYKTSMQGELSYTRNLVYVLTAITVILIATTIYFAVRKPKVKTTCQIARHKTNNGKI